MQANCVSETQICLYASHKTAHAPSDDFSFYFFKRAFSNATKCVACATRHGFSVENTTSAIMSEKLIALKVNIQYFLLH